MAAPIDLKANVNVCEDTDKTFTLAEILTLAGYAPGAPVHIAVIQVRNPDGTIATAPTSLVRMLDDGSGFVITASNEANWNGYFETLNLVIEGDGSVVFGVQVGVTVDPVNDAPEGTDNTIALVDGSGYAFKVADFGFRDAIDHDGFKSVVISSLPVSGQLLLNGAVLAAGAEVGVADIQAGRLVYVPASGTEGQVSFGFQVRDDGGILGCDASDLDGTPNNITFELPLLGSLGDRVWFDVDRDGIQDAGETGVGGVSVRLKGSGVDGKFGTADDVNRTTTTDAQGFYTFADLAAGQYQVTFGTKNGYTFTTANVGDDAYDSDADGTGLSHLITLGAGEHNQTIDAGLVLKDTGNARLGDRVWFDTDRDGVQDNGELGVGGITVTLSGAGADGVFGTGDDISRTTTTSSTGGYLFDNLAAGQYQVHFDSLAGYQFTTPNMGDDGLDSDADANGYAPVVTLGIGESNLTVDAGLVAQIPVDPNNAKLGDRLWYDTDRDGVQDSGEAGVAGITVRLAGAGADGIFGNADDVSRTTTTNSAGNYLFDGLAAGQYRVTFDAVAGYNFTTRDAGGNDATDSDVDANGVSQTVTLAIGETNLTVDAGVVQRDTNTAKLGDRLWYDTDRDGVQDSGEAGVAGVTVRLAGAGADGIFGNADDVSRTTTTNSVGNYLFDNLAAGQYRVTFDAVAGYDFTSINQGGNDATDSDVDVSGESHTVTLAIGETNLTVDAGVVQRDTNNAKLGDRLWYDTDRDGVQDSNETGVSGVIVTLAGAGADGVFGTGDDVSRTTTTNSVGNYLFDNLAAGQYRVTFGAVAGYDFTTRDAGTDDTRDSDVDASGVSQTVTLAIGETNLTVDAGVVQRDTNNAKLGDRLWYDTDRDGVQDSNENGVAGITVRLAGAGADGISGNADDVSRTTTTNSAGNYLFDNLAAGQYRVTFDAVAGYNFTTRDAGGNDATDSDVDATGVSQTVTLAIGETNLTVDAGVVQKDTNKAKLGDRVWYDTDRDGVQDSNETGVSGLSVTLAGAGADGVFGTGDDISRTTTTNSTGYYLFDNLAAGQYQVTFAGKSGYNFTAANVGSDSTDSDADASGRSHVVTLGIGESNLTVDAGLVQKDTCNAKLGDRVWYDTDRDGIQDSNETGASGVTVTLAGAGADGVFGTGDDVSRTTTTNSTGYYLFDGLAAGNYRVTFGGKTGYQFTTANAGSNDALDSDVNAVTGVSHIVALGIGESNLTVDAGLVKKDSMTAAVGNWVWWDADHDGIQDTNEYGYGIRNITVRLYQSTGELVATTMTDSTGTYWFKNLAAGNYFVQFDKTGVYANWSWGNGSSLDEWQFTYRDRGSSDLLDSDVARTYANVVSTDVFYLAEGTVDASRDAGLTPIVIDLDGDGIQTIARSASDATFDLFGNGGAVESGWISGKDGFLAVDNNGNGKIDDISELFGGNARGAGFAKLSSYDSNGDGVVDARDADFAKLLIWQDLDGNHQTDAGELMTLAQAGVAALTVAYTEQPFLDAQGNLHLERSNATMADGRSVDMTDVYFNVDAADALAAGVELPTMGELLGVDNALLDQAFGGGMPAREQAAIADIAFDAAGEAQRVIAEAMKQADATLAVMP